MNKERALVTGANGFIGSRLIRQLVDEGWRVLALVRPSSDLTSLEMVRETVALEVYDGTIESLRKIMASATPTIVFHVASLFIAEHLPADIEPLIRSNLLYGTQLVETMASEGVTKLVNTGTSWQHYGNQDYHPVNLYSATKQAFEDILQYYIEAHGLQVITLSLYDTYGPDDPRPKLLNLLKRIAASNEPLAMSSGEQQIDLVHVDDVVEAYRVAANSLLRDEIQGHERYSITSGHPRSLREVVDEIEKIINRKLPITWDARPNRKREVIRPWLGPCLPGWTVRTSLDDGLRRTFTPHRELE